MSFRIGLYCLAALLLGAHYLRDWNYAAVALCLLAPLGFLYRRRASLLVLQALAYVAAGIWMHTAWRLLEARLALGQNWKVAAAILVSVTALSLLAGLLLNSRVMHVRYPRQAGDRDSGALEK